MVKEVHLLNYWMPLLRNLKEFKEIAKTEEPELRYLLEAIDRTLNNMFIETADEYGIGRFEGLMGIIPDEEMDLETRRFKVLTLWNNYVPFTRAELYKRLLSICGSEDAFDLIERYKEYWLRIVVHLNIEGTYELLAEMLDEMLPCNLTWELENVLEEIGSHILYLGGVCCTAFHYCITNDLINAKTAVNVPILIGGVSAFGERYRITHDIKAHVEKVTPLSEAVVGSVGLESRITHDISLEDKINSSLVNGMGAVVAHTKLITHDVSAKALTSGNAKVANSVNTATAFTIN